VEFDVVVVETFVADEPKYEDASIVDDDDDIEDMWPSSSRCSASTAGDIFESCEFVDCCTV
jgi:hypothetical protein